MSRRMRRLDRQELQATHGQADAPLLECFAHSGAASVTVCARGKAVAAAGITPDGLLGFSACVWLVTAEGVEKYPVGFFKAARAALKYFLSLYPVLYNYIDLRYPAAVRFAQALGGHSAGPAVNVRGESFQLFIFRRK